ncbi:MAG: type II toxin-antitoxin system HigB family toxin [Candidatus Pacebacteria bacterium]|nr:type II toxin-antitoxin system HigB family toxin [Candidatus Paceibacterota bacterium]
MRIISFKKLREFWADKRYIDSEQSLRSWYCEVKKDEWKSHSDIKKKYGTASILKGGVTVFNIKGNKYRLVAGVDYDYQAVYIKFIGTHEEYNKINLEKYGH